jgi:hypothetical protein
LKQEIVRPKLSAMRELKAYLSGPRALFGKEHCNQETVMVGTSKHATPSSHLSTDDPHLDRLLNPARFYKHPRDVIDDRRLGLSEKRAILSSWASDACAVASMPALRQIPGAPTQVPFDDIMEALQRLDELARVPASAPAFPGDNAVYPPIT